MQGAYSDPSRNWTYCLQVRPAESQTIIFSVFCLFVFCFVLFCFVFTFWPHHGACGILVPGPGIKPTSPAFESWTRSHRLQITDPMCCNQKRSHVPQLRSSSSFTLMRLTGTWAPRVNCSIQGMPPTSQYTGWYPYADDEPLLISLSHSPSSTSWKFRSILQCIS